jgi:hypothetical protein
VRVRPLAAACAVGAAVILPSPAMAAAKREIALLTTGTPNAAVFTGSAPPRSAARWPPGACTPGSPR